jgi:hypothetical protein
MVWDILVVLVFLSFGFALLFKTEAFGFLSWAIRHNVDESGKRQSLNALRFFGVLIIIACIVRGIELFS